LDSYRNIQQVYTNTVSDAYSRYMTFGASEVLCMRQ